MWKPLGEQEIKQDENKFVRHGYDRRECQRLNWASGRDGGLTSQLSLLTLRLSLHMRLETEDRGLDAFPSTSCGLFEAFFAAF